MLKSLFTVSFWYERNARLGDGLKTVVTHAYSFIFDCPLGGKKANKKGLLLNTTKTSVLVVDEERNNQRKSFAPDGKVIKKVSSYEIAKKSQLMEKIHAGHTDSLITR